MRIKKSFHSRATRAEVIPGAHNLETLKEAEVITVEKEAFIIHEYYNSSRIRHDIGVLVLEKPVESDGKITLFLIIYKIAFLTPNLLFIYMFYVFYLKL